jgi:outer membrane protein assembly factor BamB
MKRLFHVKHLRIPVELHWPLRRPDIKRAAKLIALMLSFALLGLATACYALPSPQGWPDPVLDGSTIYYSPTAGKLVAYDKDSQKNLWEFPGNQNKDLKPQAIYGTPVLSNQVLYFAAYDGNIYAVNSTNGQLKWNVKTDSPVVGPVLLKDGVIYAGNSNGNVYALQSSDGKQLWQAKAGKEVWSGPVDSNGLIAVTSMDADVYAFNGQGSLVWKSSVASAAIASTPTVTSQALTFGSFDKRIHSIEQSSGAGIWSTAPAGNWFWTAGLISGDNLYAGNLDGHIYAYDAINGAQKWQSDLGAPIRSAPALQQGVLMVATRSGTIHGLDPFSGQDKWPAIDAGAQIYANLVPTPANTVYAVTQPGTKNGARLLEVHPDTGKYETVISP